LHPLLSAFIQVCLLRRAPQDLPASAFLLYLTLGLHALSGTLLALAYQPLPWALGLGAFDTAVLALLTASLLYLSGRAARLQKSLTALAGSGALLGAVALLPTWWWMAAQASGGDLSLPALTMLVLVVWSIVVTGHVLRHSLSAPLPVGLGVAVVFYWVAVTLQDRLFPLPAT
jgi:hypothetical protein